MQNSSGANALGPGPFLGGQSGELVGLQSPRQLTRQRLESVSLMNLRA